MKSSKWIKASIIAVIMFLGFVGMQNYLMTSKKASTPTKPTEIIVATASEETQPIQNPVPLSIDRVDLAEADDEGEVASLDPASADAVTEQSLATLERIRSVPGAAPLVDEMVALLQSNPYGEISMEDLGADENGLVELNEDTMKRMIKNNDVREKWMKLMTLVAAHPEVVAAIQGQGAPEVE